jgi:hypothetical protein
VLRNELLPRVPKPNQSIIVDARQTEMTRQQLAEDGDRGDSSDDRKEP